MFRWLALLSAISLLVFDANITQPAGLLGPWVLIFDLFIAIALLIGLVYVNKADKEIYLTLALIYRCILISQPSFSNDTKRYFSDGLMWQSGLNPYLVAPTLSNLDHNSITTIYPPLAEFFFWIISLGNSISYFSLCFGFIEFVILISFFLRIKSKKSLQSFYFLSFLPLLVRETYREGHFEILPVYFLLLAILLRKNISQYLFAGMSILIKFWGILLIPKFIKEKKIQASLIYLFILSFAIFPLLYFSLSSAGLSGSEAYFSYWTFGQPLVILSNGLLPLKERIFIIQAVVILLATFLTLFYLLKPQAFICYIQRLLCLLFFSPVLHPWYFLVFIIPALLSRKGLLWKAALLLTGHNYICYLDPSTFFLSWLPVLPLFLTFFKRPLRLKVAFDDGKV